MSANDRVRSSVDPLGGSVRPGRLSLVLLALIIGIGCTKWTHPAKGEREYNSDSVICWKAADESSETEYWPRYHVYKACMIDRGWSDE